MAKIIITIGHGRADDGVSYDSGAVNGSYHEFKIARQIGKYAKEYYEATYGETCDIMNYDGNLTLQQRINKLQNNTYALIAEMHLNAGGGTGTEVYYSHGDAKGKAYASKIAAQIAKDMGVTNRGAKTMLNSAGQDYLGIIRDTVPTAVLVENVFIDNDKDIAKVKTAEGQKKCGIAIAKAIASVRGLQAKNTSDNLDALKTTVQKRFGFTDGTIAFLAKHSNPPALFKKLATKK